MSFGGGGREQYTLEYIVKVVNQGGGSALNQINQGFTKTDQTAANATVSTEKLAAASNRLSQAQMGMTKSLKSTAFGFFGITTAGAEMFGMLSMLQQVQLAQKEATEEQAQALKESGKESKAYKDATAEVVKVNRWASMTTRNFMLSIFDMIPFTIMAVHGLTKMATAAKELKAAKAAADQLRLLGFNASGVAANMLRAGTSIGGFTPQLSKFSAATTIATTGTFKLGAETVKTTKFFGAGEAALISNAIAMGKAEKAAGSTAKAMRVLGIAMKVAIPLIALEVGAQAFENNWGGFRDRINEVGVAIGNAVPQLKGLLGWIDKIGRSIVAIFVGDFERIGEIWDETTNGMADSTKEMSDKERKAMEELAEEIQDLNSSVFDTLSEAAAGDRGEQRDFLKSMGLDKDARKDMRGVLDDIEEIDQALHGFHNSIDTMRTLNIMQKFGIDVPNDMWKELAKGLSNLFDEFDGVPMFEEFEKKMEEASKQKGPGVIKALLSFMDENEDFMPFLMAHSPDIAAQLTTMLEEAGYKVDASGMVTAVGQSMSDAFSKSGTFDTGMDAEAIMEDQQNPEDPSGGGMLDTFTKALQSAVDGLPAKIKAMDWSKVGAAIQEKLHEVMIVDLFDESGKIISSDPRTQEGSGGAAAPQWLTDMLKNTIFNVAWWQSGITTAADANFWAGIKNDIAHHIDISLQRLNPQGDTGTSPTNMTAAPQWAVDFYNVHLEPLFNAENWKTAIQTLASPQFWADVTKALNDTANHALSRLQAANEADTFDKNAKGSGGMGPSQWIADKLAPLFNAAEWEKAINRAKENFLKQPIVQTLKKIITNPIGFIMDALKGVEVQSRFAGTPSMKKLEESEGLKPITIDKLMEDLGINKWLEDLPTLEDIKKKILGIPGVKDIVNIWNAAKKGFTDFLNAIWNAGGSANIAFGDTGIDTKGASPIDPTGLNLDDIFKLPSSIDVTVPSIIVNGETYTSGPLPPTINPPLGTNATPPIINNPNAILKPQSLIPDISGSTIQSITENGGREGGGMPGVWDEAYALYIDYAGTAIVKPQSVAYDLSGAKLTSISSNGEDGDDTLDLSTLAEDAINVFKIIAKAWDQIVVAKIADGAAAIADHWKEKVNLMIRLMADAANDIYNAWHEGAQQVADNMDDLLAHWEAVCDDMVSAAAEAADDIQAEMDSIEDTESTHTINVVRTSSFATGGEMTGAISAAGGRILTTHGEQMFKIGDNPGGQESIWAIPHNRPGPIVEQINARYGGGAGGGGSELNQTLVLNIKGNDIISNTKIERKIRTTIGDKRDRFGG